MPVPLERSGSDRLLLLDRGLIFRIALVVDPGLTQLRFNIAGRLQLPADLLNPADVAFASQRCRSCQRSVDFGEDTARIAELSDRDPLLARI